MRLGCIPIEPGRLHSTREDRLAVRDAGQGRGIKSTEVVEGQVLDAGSRRRGLDEREVEGWIMADQDRSAAPMARDFLTNSVKDQVQCHTLVDGQTEGVKRINLVEFKRARIEVGAFERFYMMRDRRVQVPTTRRVAVEHDGRDFQKRVRFMIKTPGFHVDDDGEKSAESIGN